MTLPHPMFEVAVVGGGPAGAVAAYMLARAGRRVVLIDATEVGSSRREPVVGRDAGAGAGVGSSSEPLATAWPRKIGESLPAVAAHLLRRIGLEGVLVGHRSAYGNVSAWGSDTLEATDFLLDPHGLGLHLDRARFDASLRAAAVEAGATLVSARVRAAERGPTGWQLRIAARPTALANVAAAAASVAASEAEAASVSAVLASDVVSSEAEAASVSNLFAAGIVAAEAEVGSVSDFPATDLVGSEAEAASVSDVAASDVVAAACVIDATGRRAFVARGAGAVRTRDDSLVALYQWAEGPRAAGIATDERTLVESSPDGWWYTAPLPEDARVLALHVDAAHARRVRDLARAVAATSHVSAAIAGSTFSGRALVAEACGARLDAFVGRGWVAVGDAALSFDPIAAQGIFNALYSGMKAGEAVDQALGGDPTGLAAYGRRLEEIRTAYIVRHAHVYGLEKRWDNRSFWALRHRS